MISLVRLLLAPVALLGSGTTTLIVGNVTVEGPNASEFQASGCAGANIAPGSACVVNVRFAPTAADARDATLTILEDTNAAHTVALHGVGIAANGHGVT